MLKKFLTALLISAFVFGAADIQSISAAPSDETGKIIEHKLDGDSSKRPTPPTDKDGKPLPPPNDNGDSSNRPTPPTDKDGKPLPPPNDNGDSSNRPTPPTDKDGKPLPPPNDNGDSSNRPTPPDKKVYPSRDKARPT